MTIAMFLLSLGGAMALGMPIAFALMACGVAMMLQQDLFDAQLLAQKVIEGADSFALLAVPFFLLAGEIMNAGGLSRRIIVCAAAVVGPARGGLGYVTIASAIVLASISGSAVADTAALAAILIPMMRSMGYDPGRAGGLIACGGIIGPIIPPSIGFVLFGAVTGVSISKLFMAGIVPGLMMGASLVVAWYFVARSDDLPRGPARRSSDVLRALKDGVWALVMPLIIIGGMRSGVFTPTEAAVVAAVYALVVAVFVYREITAAALYQAFLSAAMTSAVVMFMVAATALSAWLISVADLPGEVVRLLAPVLDQPVLLMALMMAILVVIGMPLDMTPTILILAPVLMPLVVKAGIDPVYFGVLFIMNCCIGLITPPVGSVLNTVCGVAGITMGRLMRGIWPFLLAELCVMALLVLFPALVTVPAAFFTR
jgi:tripartite ATP-independent transporter DctM subunit